MKTGLIRASWLALDRQHRFDAKFWLKVTERLKAKGIGPDTATADEVKQAIEEVDRGN